MMCNQRKPHAAQRDESNRSTPKQGRLVGLQSMAYEAAAAGNDDTARIVRYRFSGSMPAILVPRRCEMASSSYVRSSGLCHCAAVRVTAFLRIFFGRASTCSAKMNLPISSTAIATWLFILCTAALDLAHAFRSPQLPHPAKRNPNIIVRSASSSNNDTSPPTLNVAIVGAGPSGLLLAHRLLASRAVRAKVSIYETRSDYRLQDNIVSGSSRAYALGLGPRARQAIKSVDEQLWTQVSSRGYPCDRFTLHVTPKIKLRLRDGVKKLPRKYNGASVIKFEEQGDQQADPEIVEPSVLIYQTDLCAALADGLEERYGRDAGGRVQINFDTRVSEADVKGGYLSIQTEKLGSETTTVGPFDFVAGCGGVNSPVREGIAKAAPEGTFEAETRNLPGSFKVARLPSMPPLLDPTSVALVLPSKPKADKSGGGDAKDKESTNRPKMSSGTMSAFVEPVTGGGACILFAGRGGGDSDKSDGGDASTERKETLLSDWRLETFDEDDIKAFSQDILSRFPLLEGTPDHDMNSMVKQLLTQRPGVAAAVKCNAFHFGKAALCGDAAHATGGVSGQGVNSALVDSAVLAQCIEAQFLGAGIGGADVEKTLSSALLAYSQRQVPEGLALYDLSFGPEGELGLLGRIRVLLSTIRDTLFGGRFGVGKPLLQVQLSQSTRSFSDIRRDRNAYYGVAFPDDEAFRDSLATLYDV